MNMMISYQELVRTFPRFIAYLINALGVTQGELKTLSIKNIMDRLSHMANEVKFPDVTDDSLRDWLEKAGYR
ncbi:hypothetical protein KDU74_21110 [Enterobacter cloacae]|uniref:hypothetical protein n=1 Tax=Enterobacter cloacae TaxID=550 RepID=UPI001BA496CE|nr:hypothetical protein [Enterobacter cloacae]QUG51239.1 hypothetical protein KDU74_21110 [Enterobacter cloacae]